MLLAAVIVAVVVLAAFSFTGGKAPQCYTEKVQHGDEALRFK